MRTKCTVCSRDFEDHSLNERKECLVTKFGDLLDPKNIFGYAILQGLLKDWGQDQGVTTINFNAGMSISTTEPDKVVAQFLLTEVAHVEPVVKDNPDPNDIIVTSRPKRKKNA